MRRALLVAALALGACSPALRTADRGALVVAVGALACDWHQTRHQALAGWPGDVVEHNPVLGAAPSTGAVDAYFAASAALALAAWVVAPRSVRWVLPVALGVAEVDAVAGNVPWSGGCL